MGLVSRVQKMHRGQKILGFGLLGGVLALPIAAVWAGQKPVSEPASNLQHRGQTRRTYENREQPKTEFITPVEDTTSETSTSTTVTVNGQNIPVPADGRVHEIVDRDTSVNIQNSSESSSISVESQTVSPSRSGRTRAHRSL